MRKSVVAFALPLLLVGCGGSNEPSGSERAPADSSNAVTRNSVTFKLDTGVGGAAPVVLNFTSDDTHYRYYEGTWKGQKVRFADSANASSLTIWNGNLAIASYTFMGYRVSDFGTVTKQSVSSQYSYYDSSQKTQIKFKLAAGTASPP